MTSPVPDPDGVAVDDPTTTDLVARLLDHCALVCETGDEGPIADAVAQHHRRRGDDVHRIGNSLVIRAGDTGSPAGGDRPLVVLAGHLDVVAPTPADHEPRRESIDDVDVVVGRGSSDMKSGNVVAMRIFERVADGDLGTDAEVVLVLYAAEEGPAEDNELAVVLDEVPWLARADLVVILEPTDGEIQLGCLGGVHATVTVHGRQAHSARPWHGRNALTAAGGLLTAFDRLDPVAVELDGVTFHDVWSITQAATPNGRNVIPGRVDLNLNYRFSPSRDLDDAEAELRRRVAALAAEQDLEISVTVTDRARPAAPMADRAVTASFIAAIDVPVTAKQAWTDVARFAAHDVPAINFGPGRTDQAHQRGEFVEVWRLRAAHDALESFLTGLRASGLPHG